MIISSSQIGRGGRCSVSLLSLWFSLASLAVDYDTDQRNQNGFELEDKLSLSIHPSFSSNLSNFVPCERASAVLHLGGSTSRAGGGLPTGLK